MFIVLLRYFVFQCYAVYASVVPLYGSSAMQYMHLRHLCMIPVLCSICICGTFVWFQCYAVYASAAPLYGSSAMQYMHLRHLCMGKPTAFPAHLPLSS